MLNHRNTRIPPTSSTTTVVSFVTGGSGVRAQRVLDPPPLTVRYAAKTSARHTKTASAHPAVSRVLAGREAHQMPRLRVRERPRALRSSRVLSQDRGIPIALVSRVCRPGAECSRRLCTSSYESAEKPEAKATKLRYQGQNGLRVVVPRGL